MQTEEEKLEGISIEEEKKIKKISTIVMIAIIVIGLLITLDILLVSKAHVGPFLAIRTKVYDDGGTKEYYGLGYKVIKYNQKIGRRDTIIGSWSIKYDTTPTNYTLEDLAFSIINDNNNHIDEFIRLTGTIKKVDKSNKTLTLTYEDDVYTELKKGLPSIGSLVENKEGLGKVTEVDVFKRTYKAEFKDKGVLEFSVNE